MGFRAEFWGLGSPSNLTIYYSSRAPRPVGLGKQIYHLALPEWIVCPLHPKLKKKRHPHSHQKEERPQQPAAPNFTQHIQFSNAGQSSRRYNRPNPAVTSYSFHLLSVCPSAFRFPPDFHSRLRGPGRSPGHAPPVAPRRAGRAAAAPGGTAAGGAAGAGGRQGSSARPPRGTKKGDLQRNRQKTPSI